MAINNSDILTFFYDWLAPLRQFWGLFPQRQKKKYPYAGELQVEIKIKWNISWELLLKLGEYIRKDMEILVKILFTLNVKAYSAYAQPFFEIAI